MSKALYRKYRPCALSEVIGQSQVTDILSKSLKTKKFSHAYLFIGPRGTGKTSVARIFAHEVNGFKYQIEDDYVDIIEIDGASNRGIDNIRELREKALIAPTIGKYKIYIIDEVHMLTKEAFNALLKTLEEPPKHVIFIMATTDAHKVPVTITSRAQCYTFKLADKDTMFKFLKKVCADEKIKINDDALEIVVGRGGGSFRDSLSLLDQISTLSDKNITKKMVLDAIGLPDAEKIVELLDDYSAGELSKVSTDLKNLLLSGIKPEMITEQLIAQIMSSPQPSLISLLDRLTSVRAPFAEAKLLVALAEDTENVKHRPSTTASVVPAKTPVRKSSVATKKSAVTTTTESTPQKSISSNQDALSSQPFDWSEFISKVHDLNDAIYMQLQKTTHKISGGIIEIFPELKVAETILSRDANVRILESVANGHRVIVHNFGEKNDQIPNDELLNKISDIMGGEVKNDAGGNPFE